MIGLVLALLATQIGGQGTLVSVEEARTLSSEGALLLDARPRGAFREGHLPSAVRIDWEDFRDGWGRTGRLSDDDFALGSRLGALGVEEGRAILVYGAATAGFGEEGRVAWMLTYLGHSAVRVLDGGYRAWTAAGGAIERGGGRSPTRGHFQPKRRAELRADLKAVVDAPTTGDPIVDARSIDEYRGATPYFEARGGHVPGARSLPWTELFDEIGRTLPAAKLEARLTELGLRRDQAIILYCTGGVRAAMAWVVLRSLGYNVKNFDASYWAWASRRDLPVEVR